MLYLINEYVCLKPKKTATIRARLKLELQVFSFITRLCIVSISFHSALLSLLSPPPLSALQSLLPSLQNAPLTVSVSPESIKHTCLNCSKAYM